MTLTQTVHLVDGTYELFRAHYSKRPGHRGPDGRELKATVGLAASLLALLHDPEERVTHCAVAFDNPIYSFRNALFDGYKSDEGVPPELREQFDSAEEAVRALGVACWSMREFEADDALATGAALFSERAQVRILSPDKDLTQCLEDERVVAVDRRRQRVVTAADVRRERGIEPESIPDFLALVGDAADGIPGLPGFGEKGAGVLLGRFRHLEEIPEDAAHWGVSLRGAEGLAATLRGRRDDALLYRRLATLVRDVPLGGGLEATAWNGVPRPAFEAWCDRLGVTSIRGRPTRWAEAAS